ncbi:PTS system galactose-specific transporter subunit IIB [Streptococcus pneumoniae]|nr:PTS system galactose-specific transporter subunit IIB [Streptococcus pneumoniae]
MKGYDIFTPIAATDLGFEPGIPVIEAGPILFCIPAMSVPVFDIAADFGIHGFWYPRKKLTPSEPMG